MFSKFDPKLDREIEKKELEFGDGRTKIIISLNSYDKGPIKMQLGRINMSEKGPSFAKLGRLTQAEATEMIPVIQKLLPKMTSKEENGSLLKKIEDNMVDI